MFDLVMLTGTSESWLKLQTRKRNDILNTRGLDIDDMSRRQMATLLQKFPRWEVRRPAAPGYNCAGLVWANRRTTIIDGEAYQLIYSDDGYRKIKLIDCQLGDLVVYLRTTSDEIIHVGVVHDFRKGDLIWKDDGNPRQSSVPYVLSKMCDWGAEVVHHYFDFPQDLIPWRTEFWTERP